MLCAWVLILAPLVSQAGPTPAERIERARALEAQLEYEQAHEELMAALADERIDKEQLFDAHLRAGVIARILEKDTEARGHFLYVLKRRPDATLALGTAPKIVTFFEIVREEVSREAAPWTASAGEEAAAEPAPNELLDVEAPARQPPAAEPSTSAGETEPESDTAAFWITGGLAGAAALALLGVAGAAAGGAAAWIGFQARDPTSLGTVDARGTTLGEIDARSAP